jgi:hypothetical protein
VVWGNVRTDIEQDFGVRGERDAAWVPGARASVEEGGDMRASGVVHPSRSPVAGPDLRLSGRCTPVQPLASCDHLHTIAQAETP